eukprot:Skav209762  [mRNA]  locus=scaffold9:278289:279909:- [translate_table: standard]
MFFWAAGSTSLNTIRLAAESSLKIDAGGAWKSRKKLVTLSFFKSMVHTVVFRQDKVGPEVPRIPSAPLKRSNETLLPL